MLWASLSGARWAAGPGAHDIMGFAGALAQELNMEAIKIVQDTPEQDDRPFTLDKCVDPGDRPNGSRNKTSLAIDALLESASDAITRKVIDKALSGDMTALRLCFERLMPPRRDLPFAFELPRIESAADASSASTSVLAACAKGALSPGEAATFMDLIATHVRALELVEIEARVSAMEKGQKS